MSFEFGDVVLVPFPFTATRSPPAGALAHAVERKKELAEGTMTA